MKRTTHKSEYFYGNKISEYGLEHGYVDYSTLAKAFDAVLVNDITKLFYSTLNGEFIEPELINGYIDNSEEIEELQDRINELEEENEDESKTEEIEELQDRINELEEEQDRNPEIFQYFIISASGAEILQEYTNDPLYYIDTLNLYIWGVTHWGTAWTHVLTDIALDWMVK